MSVIAHKCSEDACMWTGSDSEASLEDIMEGSGDQSNEHNEMDESDAHSDTNIEMDAAEIGMKIELHEAFFQLTPVKFDAMQDSFDDSTDDQLSPTPPQDPDQNADKPATPVTLSSCGYEESAQVCVLTPPNPCGVTTMCVS
ncbi:hypothetical protein MA16_Dca004534 [Dendrobium catenatum]|uniref:Uncharacterized protein n=1 Tax=Dendrobium catenatum TaxID=906689 RepID=A0A2I0W7S0_9ASPA|nr:hypothetical protein MA16_Dca004534 [Dendrobium catenatum]